MRNLRLAPLLSLILPLSACTLPGYGTPGYGTPEATSLLGQELIAPTFDEETLARYEGNLAAARADHEASPTDPDAWIWYGRRTAYLGRYRDAIDIYSAGAEAFPEDPRFLRHRGHRYISVRQFEDAVDDLSRAADLAASMDDVIEPDGMPNARGIPTSTLKTNIYYHLGLAHYLRADYERAEAAYLECLRFSKNPDMECATRYWLYLTRMHRGLSEEARATLAPVRLDWDVIENTSYHRLLLAYKGELGIAELEPDADTQEVTPSSASLAYGVASFYRIAGDSPASERLLNAIVSGDGWAAFGFIAAEADLARAR